METSDFEVWWASDLVASAPPAEGVDVETHVRTIAELAWDTQQENLSPSIPNRFVTPEEAQVLAMDLVRRYLMLCGCHNLKQTQQAAVKLLGVAENLVEETDEKKAVRLVNSDGKNIID